MLFNNHFREKRVHNLKFIVSHDCEDVILESLILFPFSMSIRTAPSDQHANVIQNEDSILQQQARRGREAGHL